jgi:acyl-coenzyme A thioesterase 13
MSSKRDSYNNPDLSLSLEDRVKALGNSIAADPDYVGFDKAALNGVKLVKVEPGHIEWEMTILPTHANKSGNLHGGCAATILDNVTSTTLLTIAKPGSFDGAQVSRTITMSYLRPVPIGTKVKIECEVIAGGKNTANLWGAIKTMDGKTCVTCVHDKVIFNSDSLRRRPDQAKL